MGFEQLIETIEKQKQEIFMLKNQIKMQKYQRQYMKIEKEEVEEKYKKTKEVLDDLTE